MSTENLQLISRIFKRLWQDYRSKVPQVTLIEDALRAAGETWSEDHVAFRTLPGANTGAAVLQQLFELLGYVRMDSYHFEEKQLSAFWMEPPLAMQLKCDQCPPKIFVSELIIQKFSAPLQKVIQKYTCQIDASIIEDCLKLKKSNTAVNIQKLEDTFVSFLSHGPLWARPCETDYEICLRESEYAAWTLVYGNVVNHFTVSVFLMSKFKTLESFNKYCKQNLSVTLNGSGGGEIKGTPQLKLEQSATLAAPLPVLFQDKLKKLPYAFVEFAFRHVLDNCTDDKKYSSYYQGFVINNADKIFESTDVLQG